MILSYQDSFYVYFIFLLYKRMWDMERDIMERYRMLNNENKLIVLAAIKEIGSGCRSAPSAPDSDENKNE